MKESKEQKLKSKELKKIEAFDLQDIKKKATTDWKLRCDIQEYNTDRNIVRNLDSWVL